MAAALAGAGLSAMPYAGASQNDCSGDEYLISDDEDNPTDRSLQGDMEIGLAEVGLLDGDRVLFVDVTDNDGGLLLDVEVFDESDGCASICDFDVTGTGSDDCEINAPSAPGTNEFYVHLEEAAGTDEIKFEIWHEPR